MTPLQFAREECANHQPDGSCLGVWINEDLSITRGDPKPRCLLAGGKRCRYFEECVAPMADMASDPRRAAEFQSSVAEYRQTTNQKAPKARPCPDCGAPMLKGKQYCPRCAEGRRKATYRDHKARVRRPAVDMSTEVQKNHANSPANRGSFLRVSPNAIGDSHPPQIGSTSVDIRPLAGRVS